MAQAFKLPDLGEGIHEGEVLAVLVGIGDAIKEGDLILEVETDKAAVEIPSPYTGKVSEILVKPGDTVKVGDVMMRFASNGAAAAVKAVPVEAPLKAGPPPVPAPDVAPENRPGPVPASPATRRLARELGVDLRDVPPSGPAGLVTAEDVRAFAAGDQPAAHEPQPVAPITVKAPPTQLPDTPTLPDFAQWGPVTAVAFRSIRRATARQMALAWQQIPHVSSQMEIDITDLEAFRQKHKDAVRAEGGRLTLTILALKAATAALKHYPNFNSSLDPANERIIQKNHFHIGVAVDTDDGLIVPVVRDVDRKSITELAVEVFQLAEKTRARKTSLEDLQGGTFTITNTGALGGGQSTPIINYPQVAILGMGAAQLKPTVVTDARGNNTIAPRLILPLVLSFDHRVVDGAEAVRFLQVIRKALGSPENLLLTMS